MSIITSNVETSDRIEIRLARAVPDSGRNDSVLSAQRGSETKRMHQEHVGHSVTRWYTRLCTLILAWQHGNRASSLFLAEQPAAWLARVKVTALLATRRRSRGYHAWSTRREYRGSSPSRPVKPEEILARSSRDRSIGVLRLDVPRKSSLRGFTTGESHGWDKNKQRRNYCRSCDR